MDSNALALTAGVVLSLGFEFVPNLKDWYNAKDNQTQKLIMLAALLVVALAVGLSACGGLVEFSGGVVCDRAGLIGLAKAVLGALAVSVGANQATFALFLKK